MCTSGIMYEEEDFFDNEFDRCVVTGKVTPYRKTDHIDFRKFYVEGVGQLSEKAWRGIYDNK